MRLPCVRFTARRTMVAVAVVAVLAGDGFISWRRRSSLELVRYYQRPVVEFTASEQQFLNLIQNAERSNVTLRRSLATARSRREDEIDAAEQKRWEERIEEMRSFIEMNELTIREGKEGAAKHGTVRKHYQRLVVKYERAANRLWLPLEPDPPPPK